MIVTRVIFSIKPVMNEEFLQVVRNTTQAVPQLKGCKYFGFYRDLEKPHTYFFSEEWETEADFNAFHKSTEFKELSKVFDMLNGKPSATYFSGEYMKPPEL